jgi:hypothetical protein
LIDGTLVLEYHETESSVVPCVTMTLIVDVEELQPSLLDLTKAAEHAAQGILINVLRNPTYEQLPELPFPTITSADVWLSLLA